MALISVTLLLAACVAFSSACCAPEQWEGIQRSLGGYASRGGSGSRGILQEYVRVSYDAINQRTAYTMEFRSGEFLGEVKIVARYDLGEDSQLSVVDLTANTCYKQALNSSTFSRACISDEAEYVGDFYLGVKGGLKVSSYRVQSMDATVYITVSDTDDGHCMPVVETVYGSMGFADLVQSIGFLDVTSGIANESVFDVSSDCEEREGPNLPEEYYRQQSIMGI